MVTNNRKRIQDYVGIEITEHMKLLDVWHYRTDHKRKQNFTTSKFHASTFPLLMALKSAIYVLRIAKDRVNTWIFSTAQSLLLVGVWKKISLFFIRLRFEIYLYTQDFPVSEYVRNLKNFKRVLTYQKKLIVKEW